MAKTPGKTYCFHGTCHRVKTIAETQALVGVEETLSASHYDDCKRDRYNPCGLTSSGERFHADRPDNTASPIYPDGTTLLVWSPETERALIVRVNNAGPYWGNRKLDLSRAAAERLGFEKKGVAKLHVRVVKAPEPEETRYVRNRTYPPVPGDIGQYASLAQAHTGMVVALALQASAASPLAPVTTANAFATPGAEPLVAEAPQVLGRTRTRLASLQPPAPRLAMLGLDDAGVPGAKQSRRQLAALSVGRDLNQSVWGEDLIVEETAPTADSDAAKVAAADRALDKALAKVRAKPESKAESKPESKPESKAEKKHAARRERSKEARPARSRKVAQHTERESRKVRSAKAGSRKSARSAGRSRSQRVRVGYAEERFVRPAVVHERSAGQIMSLGIRAQASSL